MRYVLLMRPVTWRECHMGKGQGERVAELSLTLLPTSDQSSEGCAGAAEACRLTASEVCRFVTQQQGGLPPLKSRLLLGCQLMRGVPVVIWHLYAVSLVLASKDMAALPLITFHFIASVSLHLAAAALAALARHCQHCQTL